MDKKIEFKLMMPDGSYRTVEAENELQRWTAEKIFNHNLPFNSEDEDKQNGDSQEKTKPMISMLKSNTGSGKTYNLCSTIGLYIDAIGKDEFFSKTTPPIAICSSTKSALPESFFPDENKKSISELEKILVNVRKSLTKEEYDKCVLVYRSTLDNLHVNLTEEMKSYLRKEPLFEEVGIKLIKSYEAYQNYPTDETLAENVTRADKELRMLIAKFLHVHWKSMDEKKTKLEPYQKLAIIRNNAKLRPIEKLYPEVALPEKKIIILSVHKVMNSCRPMICSPAVFYNLPFCKNGHLIIDESDKAYVTLRDICIDTMPPFYNQVSMCKTIYQGLAAHPTYDSLFLKDIYTPSKRNKQDEKLRIAYEGNGEMVNGLVKDFADIENDLNLTRKSCITTSSELDEEDEKSVSLFRFESYHALTILRASKKYSTFQVEEDCIRFGFSEEKAEPSRDTLIFLERIEKNNNNFYNFLGSVSNRICQKNKMVTNLEVNRHIIHTKFEFNFEQNRRDKSNLTIQESLLQNVSSYGRNQGFINDRKNMPFETCLANTGFRFQITRESDDFDELPIKTIQFFETKLVKTPESMLIAAAKHMPTTLVSATADLNSTIANFNLDYLRLVNGEELLPTKEQTEDIRRYENELKKGSENVKVTIERMGCTKEYYLENALALWNEIFNNEKKKKTNIFNLMKSAESKTKETVAELVHKFHIKVTEEKEEDEEAIFQSIRLLKLAQFVKEFILKYNAGEIPCAIYFSNRNYKNTTVGSELRQMMSQANIYGLFDKLIEHYPIKANNGQKLKAKDFILFADSSELQKQKKRMQQNMDNEMPVILITAYNTSAVAQNFQLFIPKKYRSKTTHIGARQTEVKDNGYFVCNIPCIGLEKPTHLVYNSRDIREEIDINKKVKAGTAALFDILSISDAKDISVRCNNALVREVMNIISNDRSSLKKLYVDEEDESKDEKERYFALMKCAKQLRESGTAIRKQSALIYQAVGRMNRVSEKFKKEFIYVDEEITLAKFWYGQASLTHEMDALYNAIGNQQETGITEDEWSTYAIQTERRAMMTISSFLGRLRESKISNELYSDATEWVLRHFTISQEEYNKCVYHTFYLPTPNKETCFYTKFDKESHKDIYIVEECLHAPKAKKMTKTNIETTRLPLMLKTPGFKEYLENKGIPTDWSHGNDYILCTYAMISLYSGAIGEEYAKFILEKEGLSIAKLGIKPGEEMLFELMDYRFMGTENNVLLDVKNWASVFTEERTIGNLKRLIVAKAYACNSKKMVYINCMAQQDLKPYTFTLKETIKNKDDNEIEWEVEILSVPTLVDNAAKILSKNIQKIREFTELK